MKVCMTLFLWLGCMEYSSSFGGDHLGCFKDYSERTLATRARPNIESGDVLEECFLRCRRDRNMTYAGVEAGVQCYCADTILRPQGRKRDASRCGRRCLGDESKSCGGSWLIDIYTVCPRGSYKDPKHNNNNCDYKCHCRDQAICDYKSGTCPNGCEAGWTGVSCQNRDFSYRNGGCEHQCRIDLREDYCSCNYGYTLQETNNTRCTDIDECNGELGVTVSSSCHHCTNSIGGYNCTCNDGFVLSASGKECDDIDECQGEYNMTGNSSCHHCTNTIGSYNCTCNKGFELSTSGKECKGIPSRKPPIAPIAIGVILVVLVGVLVAVVVIFLVKRKRKQKDCLTEDKENTTELCDANVFTNPVSTCKDALYENINPQSKEDASASMQNFEKTANLQTLQNNLEDAPSTLELTSPELIYKDSKFVKVEELQEYVAQKRGDKKALKAELDEIPQTTGEYEYANQTDLKIKNRFKNILPYDNNRVVLDSDGTPLSDYINASYVKGYQNNETFIASHGPSPTTLVDFWRMVWEKGVHVVVMVTNLVEELKRKCEMYWPEECECNFGSITIQLTAESKWPDYTIRTFQVAKDGNSSSREVKQFHFTSWPDHGAPAYAAHLLRFRRKVRKAMMPGVLTLVHCSAGVGRTGTFLALDWLLHQAKAEGGVDIYQCVHMLRKARMQMVQTVDQYLFLHSSLVEALNIGDTSSSLDVYHKVYSTSDQLDKQFKMLKALRPMMTSQDTKIALQKENRNKNRTEVLPADKHRVRLMSSFSGHNDYINAVYIPTYRKKNGYIATQLPLSGTELDFWRMVFDYGLTSVVLLEDLATKPEFALCLPTEDCNIEYKKITIVNNGEWLSGDVTVHDITVWHGKPPQKEMLYMNTEEAKTEKTDTKNQIVKVLTMSKELSCQSIMALNNELSNTHGEDEEAPIVLVCRDGTSNCGLFIAASILMSMVDTEGEIDVFYTVLQIKANRPEFICTQEQFRQLHDIMMEYIEGKE